MTNDSIRVMRRPRRAWLPDALTMAVIITGTSLYQARDQYATVAYSG